MAKSPLTKDSKKAISIRNSKNVVPLHFTIHYKGKNDKNTRKFDVSHLLHFRADKNKKKLKTVLLTLEAFVRKLKSMFIMAIQPSQLLVFMKRSIRISNFAIQLMLTLSQKPAI